ncbi:MAG TPA: ABC transporter permease [Bryobacteraceae bacterium]|nr:ABC transporter permease [Bryobacteraceae bacterium]
MRHHWRTNAAAAAGLAIAVAVLAGAFNVGESVRASLRELAVARLGATQFAVTSDTSFREELLPEAPLIALEAVVTHDGSGRRASRVALYAVDERFWRFHDKTVAPPGRNQFLLSDALASELGAKAGDNLLVRVPRASEIPTESLHGKKDDPGRTVRGTMREVVTRAAMGEFSLRPQQGGVRAVFVNLARFQRDLEMDGRVNVALAKSNPTESVRAKFQLEDVALRLKDGFVSHESMMLDDATVAAIQRADPQAQAAFTYLANTIRRNGKEIPYSVVTAMDLPDLASDGDIVLNEWAARDLEAKPGDLIEIEYYLWDPTGRLVTKVASFRNSGTVKIEEWHRNLAPEYPGISDAPTISDWEPPFPMDLGRIRPADEEYWNQHRATPKAFVRLYAGQKLWRSRYGAVTGMRTSLTPERLRAAVNPLTLLQVQDVRTAALDASKGATDFGEYFVYFSFFLVVSALLLAAMFFRFGLEQRAGEIATLRSLGWSIAGIRRLMLTEAAAVAITGSLLGSILAFAYSQFVIFGLRTWWVDAVGTRDLYMVFSPLSIAVGVGAGLLMALLVVVGSLRAVGKQAPRQSALRPTKAARYALMLVIAAVAMLPLGGAGAFFGVGALLLAAALTWLYGRLKRRNAAVNSIPTLGLRYSGRRPGRAVLSIALIASATFLIVAIDSFRRGSHENAAGPRFFAESAIPIYYNPNTQQGRETLNLEVQSTWIPFRLRPGDDASCLNLYQPQNPRVIGAPSWWLEFKPQNDGTIPAAVDANTLQYALHKKLGDVITVGNARLKFTQVLRDSVFQSEIVINDVDFQRAFPEEQGFRVFLIDAAPGADAQLEKSLADYGLDVTLTADRIAAFHRVENTYLSTFQALGALGLILGTAGLAAVLLRNVLERRRELALLRATGFNTAHLSKMILAENIFLLAAGLLAGIVCASIAVLPTVIQRGGSLPWLTILLLSAGVAIVGLASSWLAVRVAVRSPLLSALRSEA